MLRVEAREEADSSAEVAAFDFKPASPFLKGLYDPAAHPDSFLDHLGPAAFAQPEMGLVDNWGLDHHAAPPLAFHPPHSAATQPSPSSGPSTHPDSTSFHPAFHTTDDFASPFPDSPQPAPVGKLRTQSADPLFPYHLPPSKSFDGSYGGGQVGAEGGGGAASGGKGFIPCKVCGDKASGYHYGVTSCEGCKGFFRRSIQKQIEYRCLRDGKCMVFRLNRNRCQYCRFKKCLAVGMSRDSVRYGRVPKRSRERAGEEARVSSVSSESECAPTDAPPDTSELEKHQLALYDVILSVSQAHHSNCPYTDDKIKNLAQRPIHLEGGEEEVGSTEALEGRRILLWETLAQFTTPEIQRVVEFAKRIPGFTELEQEDQLVLVKGGFFEVWLVRLARMFNPHQRTLTFSDGSTLTAEQLSLVYTAELVEGMETLAGALNALHLNDGELGLLSGVVLLSGDRAGLRGRERVEELQERLLEALKLQLSRSRASDPHVFPNLLLKLTQLRAVGALHHSKMDWYREHWARLSLPPLFAEIFDIPKTEEAAAAQANLHPPPPPPLHYKEEPPY